MSNELTGKLSLMVNEVINRHLSDATMMMKSHALDFAEDPDGPGKERYDYEKNKSNTIKQLRASIRHGFDNFKLEKEANK